MSEVLLEVEQLTFRYHGGFSVGPVTGCLPPGLYHLKGDNGCGKTTLLRVMVGELKPSSGRCLALGEDTWAKAHARRSIAMLPSEPDQPEFLTIDELWQFNAALRRAPGWDGVSPRRELGLPGGLRLAHASSGQRRRAELLATLAGDPPVLLLDEPFANLDEQGVEVLAGWLTAWRTTRATIVTSHQPLPLAVDARWTLKRGERLELGLKPASPRD